MKQIFLKNIKTLLCLALVLCTVLLPLVSCKALKDFAESKPKDPETTTDNQTDDPAPVVKYQRTNMKYTFLGVTEGNETGTLGSLTYSVFDTAQLTVNEIVIPVETYVNNGNKTIAETYKKCFEAASSGGYERAVDSTCRELMRLLSENLLLECDYYLFWNRESVEFLADFVGGIEVNVPFAMEFSDGGKIESGFKKLNASDTFKFLNYPSFTKSSRVDAIKIVKSALFAGIKTKLSRDNIALFMIDLRGTLFTDIPRANGTDIFFLQKLVDVEREKYAFSTAETQRIIDGDEEYAVVLKSVLLKKINTYVSLYKSEIESDDFDKEKMFCDPASKISTDAYYSTAVTNVIHNSFDIMNGVLILNKK